MIQAMVHRLSFGLSRELWLVQVGIFWNYLGYGAVLPFEIIYLHDSRGFNLSVSRSPWLPVSRSWRHRWQAR